MTSMGNEDTYRSIYFLRGVAILAVVVNHYLNAYVTDQFANYANGFVSLFFVLSGYGIYQSLSKSGQNTGLSLQSLYSFFVKRFIRIYPLYWIAVAADTFLTPRYLGMRTYLAIPFIPAGFKYWFIGDILQCYVLAPIIFLVIIRVPIRSMIFHVALILTATSVLFYLSGLPYSNSCYVYRYVFFGHLYLFALGMMIPYLISHFAEYFRNRRILLIVLGLFLLSVHFTRGESMIFSNSHLFLAWVLVLSAPLVCAGFLFVPLKTRLFDFFIFAGKISFSLYLFCDVYFLYIHKAAQYISANYMNYTQALLIPGLFVLCHYIEKLSVAVVRPLALRMENSLLSSIRKNKNGDC